MFVTISINEDGHDRGDFNLAVFARNGETSVEACAETATFLFSKTHHRLGKLKGQLVGSTSRVIDLADRKQR